MEIWWLRWPMPRGVINSSHLPRVISVAIRSCWGRWSGAWNSGSNQQSVMSNQPSRSTQQSALSNQPLSGLQEQQKHLKHRGTKEPEEKQKELRNSRRQVQRFSHAHGPCKFTIIYSDCRFLYNRFKVPLLPLFLCVSKVFVIIIIREWFQD